MKKIDDRTDLGVTTIDLYLTGHCNYKCGYCYGEIDTEPHMSRDMIDSCLHFAEDIGASTIELCGGEPLLSPHFEYVIEEINKKGLSIILRTNGLLIDRHMQLISKYCKWVGVSLDGLPDTNALMRSSRSNISIEEQFNRPIEAIKQLKERNREIKILLSSVASAVNYIELIDLHEYIVSTELPIDKWKIYQFIENNFRSAENASAYVLTGEQFDIIVRSIPKVLPNGAAVIHKRSDAPGAGEDCLIVHQNGKIKILNTEYGTIGKDSNMDIRNKLALGDVVKRISKNKYITYDA